MGGGRARDTHVEQCVRRTPGRRRSGNLPPAPLPNSGMILERPTLYINGRFLGQRLTGVQRYALETLIALDEMLSNAGSARPFDAVVIAPSGTRSPALRSVGFRCVGPFHGHVWEQLTLPIVTRGSWLLSF